ncbi:MAG: RluA family pseudouridine synthase [Desulfobulbaceae bacterium]|nr:RluA family pseudouridine synthase [Desulfobulbaceae bacterium]
MNNNDYTFAVGGENCRQRLDAFLTAALPGAALSRSRLKELIAQGEVSVNGIPAKAAYRLRLGDQITLAVPEPRKSELLPEAVDFSILHEDSDLLVIAKPPGLVVHPGCGHQSGTLVHGLLFHCDDLAGIGGEERPGIVHRLDKDTSGVMVVAKNDQTHQALVNQFKERQVSKIYRAIVNGCVVDESGRIDRPIGRHPQQRRKMAVNEQGRRAVTNWRVLESFAEGFAYLELGLETGRTHQIRVHLAGLNHPVSGDEVYGRQDRRLLAELGVVRQCLHSYQLGFSHPRTGESLVFVAPLWPDMQRVLEFLRQRAADV